MRDFSIIVATDIKGGIGYQGKLPWRMPADTEMFRVCSSETGEFKKRQNCVIMGRKTYFSIPKKFRPLPGRINIVLTKDPEEKKKILEEGAEVAASLEEALQDRTDVAYTFVIGGEGVYKEAMKMDACICIHRTLIHKEYQCDTFFEVDESLFFLDGDLEAWPKIEETEGNEKGTILQFLYYKRHGRADTAVF